MIKENFEHFEQLSELANAPRLEAMQWLAMPEISVALIDLIDEFWEDDQERFYNVFGFDLSGSKDSGTLKEHLEKSEKYGFLAKIQIPFLTDFTFDPDGIPKSYSQCSIWVTEYIYQDSIEGLFDRIFELCQESFTRHMELSAQKQSNE